MPIAISALSVQANKLPKNGSENSKKPLFASTSADWFIVQENVVNEAQKPVAKKSPHCLALGKSSLKRAYKKAPSVFIARICKIGSKLSNAYERAKTPNIAPSEIIAMSSTFLCLPVKNDKACFKLPISF